MLSKVTYGNGNTVSYTYNQKNQLVSVYSLDALTTSFSYDTLGRHTRTDDGTNGLKTFYTYNSGGEMTAFTQYKTGISQPWLHCGVQKDNDGKTLAVYQDMYGLGTQTTSFLYGDGVMQDKSLVYEIALNGQKRIEYGYDHLGQRTKRTLNIGTGIKRETTYEFLKNTTSGETSALVKTLTNEGGRKYEYTYNANGFITGIISSPASGTGDVYTSSYTYDSKGQLTEYTDTELGHRRVYTYDKSGNILSSTEYDLSSYYGGESNYVYDSEDRLISYNGETITYDLSGNPLNYRDGMTMTWKAGRQLKTLTKNSVTSTYTYDADGMRTKKQVGNSVTEYIISGDGIAALKSGSYGVYFMRDENGVPYGLRYTTSEGSNFTDYYYQYNLQGDIVSILDSTGNTVAKYTYDPWGYIVSITDGEGNNIAGNANHIANINPLRYRGYMYDTETGLYYLQSRYYDPVTGRFINADDPEILAKDQDNVLQYNLFAYCLNNPVSMHDPEGYAAANIIGGIVGGVTGAALGYLLADALGLKGWKRAALISAATAGGAVLGAFLGPYVAKLGGKVAAKLGIKTTKKVMKRSFTQLIQDITKNSRNWKMTKEVIKQSTKKGNRGGVSKERVYKSKKTGEYIYEHILKDKFGRIIDKHFRPYGK